MDVVSAPRPAIFSSYSSSLQDLRSLANALPRNLDHDSLYAATSLYASNVLPLHSHGASCDADELSSPPPLSFPQRMPPLPLQRFDSPRVVSESTATSSNPAQASQPSPPTGDSGHSSSYVTQQAQSSTSSFPVTSTFSRMQAASFNSSNAFPSSPHSAYSNSPNTPLGFGHASPAVASPALDSRMIQQGSYISSYGHSQSYGTPVTAQFPVPGGCAPLEPAQQQQSGYYPGSNVLHGGHHGGMHRKSSSAGSSAGLSDALGLHPAPYSNMSTDDASGVTHSPVLFGSPRVAEPQPDHTRLAGSPVFAPMRRPSTAPRRASLGFSPKLARSPFHTASTSFGPSSSPQAVGASPMSDHLIIPPSHSPHIQNALLPLGVRTDALMGSPSMVHATTHSPRMSFSNPTSPPSITPPSGVGLRLSPSPPHSITIIRPKAPRKPKKMLPTPEPGLVKASRGRAVPTQVELMDTGVWDGDIAAAHNKSRIRERVKMRQNARAHAEAVATVSPEGDAPGSGSPLTRGAVWDGHDHGDGNAGEDANREMSSGDARDGMPTIHVVSPRSYVCPVSTCSKAFKRREHLRRHLRSIHTNEKPHKCPHAGCTKSFSRTDNLWQHVKTHEVSGSGYHDVSPETGLDAQTHNDTGAGWQDHLAGSAGDTPLLHNPSMLDTSSNTGFGGGYPQFAPVHYEYSDIRQQQPDSVSQHPHFVQHGMPSHPMQQQHNPWGNMQQGPSSNFAHDQPSYSANSSSKLFGDNGQQYPHGRM